MSYDELQYQARHDEITNLLAQLAAAKAQSELDLSMYQAATQYGLDLERQLKGITSTIIGFAQNADVHSSAPLSMLIGCEEKYNVAVAKLNVLEAQVGRLRAALEVKWQPVETAPPNATDNLEAIPKQL